MTTNFSAMDVIESEEHAGKHGNKEITLKSEETCKALREVLERFDKRADGLILDYRTIPLVSINERVRLNAQIDTLESDKVYLAGIIKEISTKEK